LTIISRCASQDPKGPSATPGGRLSAPGAIVFLRFLRLASDNGGEIMYACAQD
jgi:hypothetical protein